MSTRLNESHGFVWPDGLPSCITCGRMPNDPIHITPARRMGSSLFPVTRVVARASEPGRHNPVRPHAYVMAGGTSARIPCAICREVIGAAGHIVGAPAGALRPKDLALPEPPTLAAAEDQPTLVVQGEGTKLVLATRAAGVVELESELAEVFGREMAATGPHLWVSGRYVGADERNLNGAFWSASDLEMGEPSVAHGPVNWLHEERHVIGAIAGSRFVAREAASASGMKPHIVALGAVWPWIYPEEAAVIRQASEAGSLWFSMECVSKEVACIEEGCGKVLDYRTYSTEKAARCEHLATGRRFVDPVFEGAGIIVPPVRPGWNDAHARVTMAQSEEFVEREAASFTGMADEEAVAVASRLLESSLPTE